MDGSPSSTASGSSPAGTRPASSLPARLFKETARQRHDSHKERRAKGESLRKEARLQEEARNHRANKLMRHKQRGAERVRHARQRIDKALSQANDAYRSQASAYAADIRGIPEGAARAKEELRQSKAALASKAKLSKAEHAALGQVDKHTRQKSARAVHDAVRSQKQRATIPKEMDEQMRRLGVGPYSQRATQQQQTGAGASPDDGHLYAA